MQAGTTAVWTKTRLADTDGLPNYYEVNVTGTDPLNSDTDGDTLNDGYETNTLKTNPLNKDTDGDGLEDDSEIKLGTNPLVADSDVDGKPDGNESYIQTFKNETAGVEATINGVGDLSKSIVLVKNNSSVLMSSLPGFVNTVDISASSQVNAVSIKIYYNESTLAGVPESDLKLFYYNETSNGLELVTDQGINTTGNYVWGNTNHLSIFGVATPSEWFKNWYVDWKTPAHVFKIGDRMRIKANIRNTGQGPASNIKVEFREGTQGGTLIGTTTISSIASGSSAQTAIEWTVSSGVNRICVNVDPANLIAEVSEGNNNACGDFYRLLDSDGDGLTDYEEINGMRVVFPYAPIKAYPMNMHSDNDGLTDGQEMGEVVYDPGNKLLYDSLAIVYGWDKSLYDGYHYEYKAHPMRTDTDGDGFNDNQEIEDRSNPFQYEPGWLKEAYSGMQLGATGEKNPIHDNLPYLSGWILSGALIYGDVRDAQYYNAKGDDFNFAITTLGLVPTIGDAASTLTKVGKFTKNFKNKISKTIELVLKAFPTSSTKYIDEILSGLKGTKGYDDLVNRINRGDVGAVFEAEVAVTKDANNIEWLGKPIITPFGSTYIDVLLKDGTIIEAKNIDWNKVVPGSKAYNDLKNDLGNKIKRFNTYDPTAKKVISFKGSVDPDIKAWLELEKGAIVEVIP